MYSTRLVRLLMVTLSILTLTQAAWFDVFARDPEQLFAVKRQDNNDSSSTTADSTSDSPTTSDEPSTTLTTETTSTASPTTTADDTSTTDDPAPTTSPSEPATTPTTTTTTPAEPTTVDTTTPSVTDQSPTSNTPTETTATGDGKTTSKTPTPTTSVTTIFTTSTMENGQATVISSTSSAVITPGLSTGGTNSGNSGLKPETRNIVIGVCVGVGGAIVLGAVGVLFWRLRNKRRNQEENEELVSYGNGFGGPGTAEKSDVGGSTSGRTPFQSTLESYHAPTQTNAASNF
ncbi:hypothetical protein F4778DRAFT_754711 [Xylariomycetidae sp. FL2044]|nr:hypothetical protein F4778DRAFT_754711 [Xylariomycetidae sp. FL2044]